MIWRSGGTANNVSASGWRQRTGDKMLTSALDAMETILLRGKQVRTRLAFEVGRSVPGGRSATRAMALNGLLGDNSRGSVQGQLDK